MMWKSGLCLSSYFIHSAFQPFSHGLTNSLPLFFSPRTASPADWSQLCVILLPILVVFGLVATLAVHFWRRYHRDKYDINAYRPDEREKLRPVKTADDHQTVRHV